MMVYMLHYPICVLLLLAVVVVVQPIMSALWCEIEQKPVTIWAPGLSGEVIESTYIHIHNLGVATDILNFQYSWHNSTSEIMTCTGT